MAISDAQKVDYLLKKIGYGISKTDTSTNKSPANESISSPLLIRGDGLYAQSDLISVVGTLPASNSSVVTVYRDSLSSAVLAVNDGTAATNRTWKTNLTDWVGPEFGSGYAVKVYTGTVQTAANASSGTSLPVDGSGNNDSWFFDYQSGVLNFADTNVPSSIAAQVWVVGARYTGAKGVNSLLSTATVGTANVSLYDNVTAYTTNQTFFPQFSNISTTGNSQTGVSSSLGFNPSTGTLSTTIVNAAHNGSIGATTPNTAVFTTATTGGLQATAIGNVTPGTGVFTTGTIGGLQATAIGNVTAGSGAFTTLSASTWANITGATQSTSSGTGALIVTGGAGIGANLYVGGNATIIGNLTVVGTTTSVQSTTLDVTDLNITVAKGASSAAAANGAGLTVDGASATILYTNATDTWNLNKGLVGTTGTFSSTLGVTGATTLTTATAGGLQAVAIGNVTPGSGAFTTASTTGNLTVGGNIAVTGNIVPSANVIYSLGTSGSRFKDIWLSGQTEYLGGAVIGEDASGNLTLTASGGNRISIVNTAANSVVITGNVVAPYHLGNIVGTNGTIGVATIGGLQAQAIGNVTPGTGVFTTGTFNTATTGGLQAVAIGNVTPGSGAFTTGTFSSTLGVTGATTMTTATTGGLQATAIGNVTPGTGVFTTGTIGGLQATAIGNVTPGTGVFTTATTGGLQATAIGNVTAGSGAFTTLSASTWANITGTTAATSTTTGALVVAGGAGVGGALYIGSTATITGNTAVNNTLYGRGVYDNGVQVVSTSSGAGNLTISTGGINLTPVGPGATSTGSATSIPIITTDAYGRISSITTALVSTAVANTALYASTTQYTTNQTFYPMFSNLSTTGNTTHGVATTITFNPGTGALGTTLLNTSGVITASGNIVAASGTNSTSATTGAVTIAGNGGLGVTGNAFFGNSVTINSTQTAGQDFIVRGKNSSSTLWVRPSATYDQVLIGGNATPSTFYSGAALQINTTDSLLLPVGSTAQRPSGAGFSDVTGMFRYSTTTGAIEWYTGSAWQSASTQFTLISDDQFNGDGTTVAFTMGAASTTSAAIVSINGVIQIPTLAYSCSGTTITFTEAPASGDVIDVRRLVTTQTITSIASTNGYMQFVTDNNGAYVYTGTSGSAATTYWDTAGAKVSALANTAVASANTATTIDTMATGTYRSAKYVIQATNGANYQVMEALLISNGTTATVLAYGTVQTAGNLGVVTATQSGSNALLQFVAANSSTNVRITKDYLLI